MGEDDARIRERLVSIECAYCGAEVRYVGEGRRPKFCSASCRSRAWELRRAASKLGRESPMPTVVREVVERVVERDRPEPVPMVPRVVEDWVPMLEELERQVRDKPWSLASSKDDFEELAMAVKAVHDAFSWREPEPTTTAAPAPAQPVSSAPPAATLSRQQRRALERERRKRG